MLSNILSRKGREIPHPLHGKIEKKNSSCYRIRPGKSRKLRLAAGFEPATYLTWGAVDARMRKPTELSDPADLREISVCMTLNL